MQQLTLPGIPEPLHRSWDSSLTPLITRVTRGLPTPENEIGRIAEHPESETCSALCSACRQ